jgi:hypothetical protein
MKHTVFAVMLLCLAVAAEAADHLIDLEIHSISGSIGWHFSRYDGPWKTDVDIHGVPIRIPTLKSDFVEIKFRDDSSQRMKPGETWHETFHVQGPGIFSLDFSDWDEGSRVEVRLIVDGVMRFSATGSTKKMYGWDGWDIQWGPGIKRTGDREVVINLN